MVLLFYFHLANIRLVPCEPAFLHDLPWKSFYPSTSLIDHMGINPFTKLYCSKTLMTFACSVTSGVSNSLWPYGLYPARLHSSWDFPGKNMERVAMPSSSRSCLSRDQTHVSCITCITGRFFTAEPLGMTIDDIAQM